MRRNSRFKNKQEKSISDKIIMYSIIGVAIVSAILVALFFYSKSLSDEVKNSTLTLEQMAGISESNTQNTENTESASTEMGKTVEESKNELNTSNEAANIVNDSNNTTTNTKNTTNEANNTSNTQSNIKPETTNNTVKATDSKVTKKEEPKKELSFQKPVEGDIVKEYARDNLIYSETLDEWVTHQGIDIKAENTTVVKSAEAGTIKSIKNDPRYGLTIVIQHEDGFETVYSNLLTSEFVVEGEKVEKGQSIGTVGNTAVFEISDEPHLHFEILKDSIQVDPSIYIK